jgi:hypothetical protein
MLVSFTCIHHFSLLGEKEDWIQVYLLGAFSDEWWVWVCVTPHNNTPTHVWQSFLQRLDLTFEKEKQKRTVLWQGHRTLNFFWTNWDRREQARLHAWPSKRLPLVAHAMCIRKILVVWALDRLGVRVGDGCTSLQKPFSSHRHSNVTVRAVSVNLPCKSEVMGICTCWSLYSDTLLLP